MRDLLVATGPFRAATATAHGKQVLRRYGALQRRRRAATPQGDGPSAEPDC